MNNRKSPETHNLVIGLGRIGEFLAQRFADYPNKSKQPVICIKGTSLNEDEKAIRLGEVIRSSRKLLGYSRQDLASVSGVSIPEIISLENGLITSARMENNTLSALAKALDEEIEDFEEILGRSIEVNIFVDARFEDNKVLTDFNEKEGVLENNEWKVETLTKRCQKEQVPIISTDYYFQRRLQGDIYLTTNEL